MHSHDHLVMETMLRTGSWVNMFAVLLVIVAIVALRKYNSLSFQIVLGIVVNDFFLYVSFVFPAATDASEQNFSCKLQGFMISYFFLSSMFWSCTTAYTIRYVIRSSMSLAKDTVKPKTLFRYFFAVCQVATLVPAIIPLTTNAIGPAGSWCWVKLGKDKTASLLTRFFCFYIFLWIAMIYTGITYYLTWRQLKIFVRQSGDDEEAPKLLKGPFQILKYYPVLLLWATLPATANRFTAIFTVTPIWIQYLHVFSSITVGILDALVFFLNPLVREKIPWVNFVRRWACCCLPSSITNSNDPRERLYGELEPEDLTSCDTESKALAAAQMVVRRLSNVEHVDAKSPVGLAVTV